MKQTQIVAGNFTEQGNFTGYNAKGERIHLNKKAMESLGWTKPEQVKFPFFAIVGEKTFNKVDANNEPIEGETFTRLQSLSAYQTKEAMISAYNSEAQLELEAKAALNTSAKASGLTEAAINALLEATV